MEKCALLGDIMSQHKEVYVISYHGVLCHNMSYAGVAPGRFPETGQVQIELL